MSLRSDHAGPPTRSAPPDDEQGIRRSAPVQPLAAVLIAAVAIPGLLFAIARPNKTILPAYAALVPVGSVFRLSVPLPTPFNTLSSLIGGIAIAAMIAHAVLYRRA